eukprot:GFKZ01000557.1.p1 GENE.GFKZ01000557.1~~GFKZ01000557.1.p1  ORF type:complete len:297 (+),score=63.52 GFKZ01000557.1:124-1014(+)
MSASRKEEEGHNLMAEAEKKLSARGGLFKSLFGGSSSAKEEAADTFVKAANTFKLAKAWSLAGSAFEKAAAAYAECSDMSYDAASKYADAAKAYKLADPLKAVVAYEKAIEIYTDSARFQQCARLQKEVAEIQETQDDPEAALKAYLSAAEFYDMEDAKSNANSMRVKVAELSGTAGKYEEAAELYESVAKTALSNSMLKYGAREHLLRAGLCLCLIDDIGAQRAVQRYAEMDSSFATSREGQLLEAVVSAVDEGDVQAFTKVVFDYDSISKLDPWKTAILLRIKNGIKADDLDLK